MNYSLLSIGSTPPRSCPTSSLQRVQALSIMHTARSEAQSEVFQVKLRQLTHAIRTRHYHILLREYECDADKRNQKEKRRQPHHAPVLNQMTGHFFLVR